METLEYKFIDKEELKAACMGFIKQGGLFFKIALAYSLNSEIKVNLKLPDELEPITFNGKIVWITPKHEQNQLTEGIGVQIAEEDSARVRNKILEIVPDAFSMKNITLTL